MTIDDKIKDQKLQCDINREAAKTKFDTLFPYENSKQKRASTNRI